MKFLIIMLAAGILIYLIMRPFLLKPPHSRQKRHNHTKTVEDMYECAHCGTFVAQNESHTANGAHFCSRECLKKGIR